MFFKDIETWTQKKLRLYCLIFNGVYFLFTVLIPIIIVGCRYQIFSSDKVRLTGWGWCLAIFIVVVSVRVGGRLIKKLPETSKKQQMLKYTLLGIGALFIPVSILVAMILLKNDFDLAYNTFGWVLFSFIFGIVVDYTCIKYLDKELELRYEAQRQNAIDVRKETLKK